MGFKGSKVQILSSRPESRNPQGSTETWIPFLFLGSALSLFPVFRLAGHFAKPDHTGQTFPAVPRIMGMVSALADLADSRQIHCPHTKNATKVSSVAFFVCAKNPGPANSRHAFGNSAVPLSTGTKTSRDGPRVPLRLPSGKGACGNSSLRLHPAF